MSSSSYVIDAVAARREANRPANLPVHWTEDLDLYFPAELPLDALDPLLSDDLDLFGLIGEIVQAAAGDAGELNVTDVVKAVFRRPRLPKKFLEAVRETYALLLDEDQYKAFLATRPGIGDYVFLTTALAKAYGVNLGKLWAQAASSKNGGETSSPTSPATTASTPEVSGFVPDNPDSSDYAG
ncbi:hypothetical protein ACWDXD_25115 [Streptomyces sp. NPDC003314]